MKQIDYEAVYGDGRKWRGTVSLSSPAALLENSGVLVVGKSILDVFDRLEIFETTAEVLITARSLAPVHPMGPEVIQELTEAFRL